MNIDPEKFYNLNEITVLGLFPWIKSYNAVRRYIEFDRLHENVLQVSVKPQNVDSVNTGVRYFVKGENIIKLLAKYEDGSLFLNYEPRGKQNGRSISQPQENGDGVRGAGTEGPAGRPEEQEGIQGAEGADTVGEAPDKHNPGAGGGEVL